MILFVRLRRFNVVSAAAAAVIVPHKQIQSGVFGRVLLVSLLLLFVFYVLYCIALSQVHKRKPQTA